MNEISALLRRDNRDLAFSFLLSGHSEQAAACNPRRPLSSDTKLAGTLIMDSDLQN